MSLKRVAIVKNNIVTNVAVWDGVSPWNPGADATLIDITDEKIGNGDELNPVTKKFSRKDEAGNVIAVIDSACKEIGK